MRSGYFVNEWSARFIVRGSVNAFMAAFATMLLTMPVSSNAHLITTPSSFDYHATINQLDRTRLSLESSDTGYSGESGNVSRLLDQLMKGYDKRLRPNYKGKLVEVGITMFISSVSSISEANMDFTLDFYFRQHWQDERLKFASSDSNDDELCISNEMLDKIWWPDTFFANAKSAQFHTATTKNAFLRIKSTGWITQSLRLTVTSSCPMDLTFFPMDRQVCSLEIESYAYSVKHIAYKWKDGPKSSVKLDKDVQLPQMKVRGYRVKEKLEVLSTGNYSRLACEFYFVRSLGYYIIQIYVPSSLIVVLSWVSFWLHRDAAPARVALGITTVLTMTTLISSTNASLPKISYLKSIDVYLVTCFVMVFASIVEYAAVSYIANVRPSARVRPKNKLPLVTTVYGHAGCGTGGCDQPNSAPPKLSWPQGQPVQTEVRLTSMRRLFTECDLHYLSVLGGRGDSDAYRIFVAANSAAGTNLASNGGGGGAIMNGGGASRNGGGGANRNGTAAHQFVPPTGSSAGTSNKQLHQQLIRRIDDSTNKQTPSSSSQPTAAADLAAVNSSSVVVRLPHPTLPSHHPTLPSHPTLPPASSSSSSPPSKHRRRPKYDHITVANAIDRYSRIGFPVAFAALSSVYWIVYIHITPSDVDRDFVFVD